MKTPPITTILKACIAAIILFWIAVTIVVICRGCKTETPQKKATRTVVFRHYESGSDSLKFAKK